MTEIVDRILHQYPYPIAKCYERLVGARDATERWNRTRYLLEATLKYCACISVSRYLHNDEQDEKTNAALACLNRPSLGHWLNLLGRCARRNQTLNGAFLEEGAFAPTRERPLMVDAYRVMREYRSEQISTTPPQKLTINQFFEAYVAYRNRTAGHGTPTAEHIESMAPILESAAIDLLNHLSVLSELQLLYVSDIRLERQTYVHAITRLMGTSQVSVSDYITDANGALVGHDRKVFLSAPGDDAPFVSMHPLMIYSNEELYLLHRSDIKSNVEYICHHTRQFYSADRIFEDFRDTLGSFLGEPQSQSGKFEPEEVYEEAVKMSLIDGVISAEEREYMMELRLQLDLNEDSAQAIEARIRASLNVHEKIERESYDNAQRKSEVDSRQASAAESTTKILFMCYSSVGNSFWAEFVSRLAAAANERDWVFSLVTSDPSNDHDAAAMATLIADIDRTIAVHNPDVLLLVPYPSSTFTRLFEKRYRKLDVPVVTIDTELADAALIISDSQGVPAAVSIDNELGGRLAAEALISRNRELGDTPRFLVVPGFDDAPHSQARVEGFTAYVSELFPNGRVRVLPEGRFDRERAERIFSDFLEDIDLNRFDGVFAANDDMALGVFSAISAWLNKGNEGKGIPIVGFNNTAEFRSVMSVDPHKLLVASVDQSLDTYTDTVFQIIDEVIGGSKTVESVRVAPRLPKA